MQTMNLREIDLQKRKIEAKYIPHLRAIFHQMNKDAITLFKATGNIPSHDLAVNFTPEFTKVIRDAMRESVITFGFLERKKSQKNFEIEKYQQLFSLGVKVDSPKQGIKFKNLDVLPTDDELERIDKEHAKMSILFVSTESQRQALYIQNTNAKELSEAQQNAIIQENEKQARIQEIIRQLNTRINAVRFSGLVRGESPKSTEALEERLQKYQNQLDDLKANKQNQIADDIQENLEEKEQSRSELIAETVVGISESWSRGQEVALIAATLGIEPKKRWSAMLDGRTREDHIMAHGQTVPINQKFTVGGERANYPRDSSLSAAQLMNCRCGVEYINNT